VEVVSLRLFSPTKEFFSECFLKKPREGQDYRFITYTSFSVLCFIPSPSVVGFLPFRSLLLHFQYGWRGTICSLCKDGKGHDFSNVSYADFLQILVFSAHCLSTSSCRASDCTDLASYWSPLHPPVHTSLLLSQAY
jgi:hypothetical protein